MSEESIKEIEEEATEAEMQSESAAGENSVEGAAEKPATEDPTSEAAVAASTTEPKKGIHWTFREVLRGKSATIFVLSLVLLYLAGIAMISYVMSLTLGSIDPYEMLGSAFALKPSAVAENLTISVIMSIPFILVFWLPLALLLWIALNIRDRKLPRTKENLDHHVIESSRAWTWPWSMLVGCIDFIAAYFIFSMIREKFDAAMNAEPQASMTLLAITIFLIFAEYRVHCISTRSAARKQGNKGTIDGLLDGSWDALIPEKYRNELGRAKIATVIHLGVVRTPRMAAFVVRGIDFRGNIKRFSAFLDSTIQGVLSAVTFGIAARTCNEMATLGSKFAAGAGDEYIEGLRNPGTKKPRYFVEIFALLACIVYVSMDFYSLIVMGAELLTM